MAIETTFSDGILQIALNNPSRGNSFGLQAAESLAAAIKKYAPAPKKQGQTLNSSLPSCRGLLLTAKGRLFCAGGDLTDYSRLTKASEGKKINRRITDILNQLSQWPLPTVCVVNGDCFGGGVELVSAFDKVLSTPDAMFGLWQRRIGLTFGWGGGTRLAQRLSTADLRQLAIETRSFSAYEALRVGLIDEIHLATQIKMRALEWLNKTTQFQAEPIASLKSLSQDPRRERITFERLWWSPNHRTILEQRKK